MFYKAAITEADDTCRTNAAGQFACGELTTQGDWRSNRPVRDNNEYHLSYSIRNDKLLASEPTIGNHILRI